MTNPNQAVAVSTEGRVPADWKAPDFYQPLDLLRAKLAFQFGDFAHLVLSQFEKAKTAYLGRDLSQAQFPRTGEEAMIELEVRAETLQWVVEMAGLTGKAADYAANRYHEDTAFLLVYSMPNEDGLQTFRCGGGSPGAALAQFAQQNPDRVQLVQEIFVDKRSLQPEAA